MGSLSRAAHFNIGIFQKTVLPIFCTEKPLRPQDTAVLFALKVPFSHKADLKLIQGLSLHPLRKP